VGGVTNPFMVTGAFTIFAAIEAMFIQIHHLETAGLTACAMQHIVDAPHKVPTVERMQR
jgi:hypothetical protein